MNWLWEGFEQAVRDYFAPVGMLRDWLADRYDAACHALAWCLPRRLVYWCGVRMVVHASGVLGTTEVGAITPADVLKSWSVGEEERL